VLLALAWAPLLWLPARNAQTTLATSPTATSAAVWSRIAFGLGVVAGLTALALVAHTLPFGLVDLPLHAAGWVALLGMAAMYLCLVLLQVQPQRLTRWRRWSYAGFYVDEAYTRLALRLWPARWTPVSAAQHAPSLRSPYSDVR
jgi:NAD(P)H-quinone oxidoreductase subunit 5